MFPFSDYFVVFQIYGEHLIEMIQRIQDGWDGFYFFDGIFQIVTLNKIVSDEDPEDFYYKKGFINATLLNGTKIEKTQIYTGITL